MNACQTSAHLARHDDYEVGSEKALPPGLVVYTGKFLMATARSAKIPFGRAWIWMPCKHSRKDETVGLVISETDYAAMDAAVDKKIAASLKYPKR